MFDLSSFEIFAEHFAAEGDTLLDRRNFMRGTALAGILPFGLGRKKQPTVIEDGMELPANPLKIIREKRFDALVAIVRAQVGLIVVRPTRRRRLPDR